LWDVLVFQDWLHSTSQPPKREINRLESTPLVG
jgi:hypothetical protein